MRAPIALRVNPDVTAGTHKYVSTGASENKFGIALERIAAVYEAAAGMANIAIRGVQMHIGSQLTTAGPFVDAIAKSFPLVQEFKERYGLEFLQRRRRHRDHVSHLVRQLSGRLVARQPRRASSVTIDEYAAALVPPLRALGLRILLEPGRLMVGNAGVLFTRVLYLKQGGRRNSLSSTQA